MPGHTHDSCDCAGEACACRLMPAQSPLPTVRPTAWEVRRRRSVRRAAAARSADNCAPERVTALVLDVGGVVIPSLFESVGLPGFPTGALTNELAWARVQQGQTTEREYWQTVAAERPGLDIAGLWKQCSRVRDELRGALDAIASRVRVVAFTNDMAHFFGVDWPERFPEMAAFDRIVEASQLGVHKPDPEAFRAVARAIDEPPERCLLVDDLASNLDGARRAGMRTRLFDVRDPAGSIEGIFADLALSRSDLPQAPRAFARSGAALGGDVRATVTRTLATATPRKSGRGPTAFRMPRP